MFNWDPNSTLIKWRQKKIKKKKNRWKDSLAKSKIRFSTQSHCLQTRNEGIWNLKWRDCAQREDLGLVLGVPLPMGGCRIGAAFPEVILGKGRISARGWCCSWVEILLPNSEIPAKKKTQLKEQTPNWELRLHGETIPRKKSVIGMDAFTNRQKYLFHSIFKVFKPHDLSFSGADSSAIVTLSESWACQEKSGDRTRPLLVTLEALQLQGLCWGHLSRRIYFG